jgi:hypothetical protein
MTLDFRCSNCGSQLMTTNADALNPGAGYLVDHGIRTELEELAANFEGAGPDAPWTGQQIARAIRERINNHPALKADAG